MPVTLRVSLVSGSLSLVRALPVVKLVSSSVANPSAVAVGPSFRPLIVMRDGGRVGAAVAVGDGVGERIRGRFAHGQTLELAVGIVGERAVAVVGHQARGTGRVDAGDRQRVAGVGIGVVGQGVAGGEAGVFVRGETVGRGRGAVVAAVDRDRDRGRVGAAVAVGDGVGERVGGRFAHGQAFELPVGIVGERAVAVVGDQARGAGRVDAGDAQRVAGVRVRVVGQGVAGGEAGVFVCGKPVGRGGGPVVAPVDRDRDGRRIGPAVAVGDRVGERIGRRFAHGQRLRTDRWGRR